MDFPVTTMPSPVPDGVREGGHLRNTCFLFLVLVVDTCWASTGAVDRNITAVVAAVATLCSKSTLKFWVHFPGPLGVVEFLYFKTSIFNEWTTVIQETKVEVLQV